VRVSMCAHECMCVLAGALTRDSYVVRCAAYTCTDEGGKKCHIQPTLWPKRLKT
jgi:hypothetical protein